MKKVLAMLMVLLLVGVLLAGMTTAAQAAEEGGDLPTVTAPPATEAPETPVITAMPDEPLAPEDADATDTPEYTDPEDGSGMSALEVATVPVLVMICFGVGQCVKPCNIDSKWIPAIMVPVGGILGFIAFHIMTDFPASDPITAVGVGVASGLAATGVHQVYKQLHG